MVSERRDQGAVLGQDRRHLPQRLPGARPGPREALRQGLPEGSGCASGSLRAASGCRELLHWEGPHGLARRRLQLREEGPAHSHGQPGRCRGVRLPGTGGRRGDGRRALRAPGVGRRGRVRRRGSGPRPRCAPGVRGHDAHQPPRGPRRPRPAGRPRVRHLARLWPRGRADFQLGRAARPDGHREHAAALPGEAPRWRRRRWRRSGQVRRMLGLRGRRRVQRTGWPGVLSGMLGFLAEMRWAAVCVG
mmetsp:Transcript_108536/g.291454  ORF Transcript_108536/g.291454 Transcript_108536/m.291454 type:complete len:247 (-) Transcript_108536:246-986(-)